MSDRSQFHAGQLVPGRELNEAFGDVEVSSDRHIADLSTGGLLTGGTVWPTAPSPTWIVNIDSFLGYGYFCGRRIWDPIATLTLDARTAGDTLYGQGGTPDGSAIALPAAGNEKWVSIAAIWTRFDTDLRVDPVQGDQLGFRKLESFKFRVVEGNEALVGSAVRPPLDEVMLVDRGDDGLLLADVQLLSTTTEIGDPELFFNRVRNFAWVYADSLGIVSLASSKSKDSFSWVGLPTNHVGGGTYERRIFDPWDDSTSRIQIKRVHMSTQERVNQTTATTIEFSSVPTFDNGDEFTITLATGTGATSWFQSVVPGIDFIHNCNNASGAFNLYWRFNPHGTHQNIHVGLDYERVA